MEAYCEHCKKKQPSVIVKNKRKEVRVYCTICNSYIRNANDQDLKILRKVPKVTIMV